MHEMNTAMSLILYSNVEDAHVPCCPYVFRGDGDEVEVETELGLEKSSTDIADWMHSNFS